MGELVRLKNAILEGDDVSPPSPDIVAYLEKKLEEAKRGELQAFGFVGVTHNLSGHNSFYIADGDCRDALVAHVAYLGVRLAVDSGAIEEDSQDGGEGDINGGNDSG